MNEISPCPEQANQTEELERLNEQLLVLQAQGRDQVAFGKLVERYDKRLLYYLRRLVGENERAADLSQEVWLTVFKKIATLQSPAAFRVWLFQIAHHRAVSIIQHDLRRDEAHEEYHLEGDPVEEWDELSLLENSRLVHQALGQISISHREVLTLRFLEDLKLNEMAQVMGCGLPTVKTRLHYAKKAIRRKIEDLNRNS